MAEPTRVPPTQIPPPPPKGCQHAALPTPNEHVVPLGTLHRCTCGRWFRHADALYDYWSPLSQWVPVRWWQFRLRRRIAEETR